MISDSFWWGFLYDDGLSGKMLELLVFGTGFVVQWCIHSLAFCNKHLIIGLLFKSVPQYFNPVANSKERIYGEKNESILSLLQVLHCIFQHLHALHFK